MAIIGSKGYRELFIELAPRTLVNIWTAGTGSGTPTFSDVAIQEIGGDYVRVVNVAGTTNAIVQLLPLASVDEIPNTMGVTATRTTKSFRSRLIEFASQNTVDIYIPGVQAAFITGATITEIGSDYIRATGTSLQTGAFDGYLPLIAVAAVEQVAAMMSTPNFTTQNFRDILVRLANANTPIQATIGRAAAIDDALIAEVESDHVRLVYPAVDTVTTTWVQIKWLTAVDLDPA